MEENWHQLIDFGGVWSFLRGFSIKCFLCSLMSHLMVLLSKDSNGLASDAIENSLTTAGIITHF